MLTIKGKFNPNLELGICNERSECASDLVTRRFEHHRHTHRYGEERKTEDC
jgi:hypothetical protein